MNKAGEEYCKKWDAEFKKCPGENKHSIFTYSAMTECAMRLGIESRAFELEDDPDPFRMSDDLERMTMAAMKRSYVENARKCQNTKN